MTVRELQRLAVEVLGREATVSVAISEEGTARIEAYARPFFFCVITDAARKVTGRRALAAALRELEESRASSLTPEPMLSKARRYS